MVIPSSILGPVVGAFISGLIGVATVEYRNYREEVAQVEAWYDQAIRLAEQIERETPDSYLADIRGEGEADETGERANDMAAAYGRIGERLRDHVNRAPPQITESVLGPATETARYCQIIDREERIAGDFMEMVGNAVNNAETLQTKARGAKNDAGMF